MLAFRAKRLQGEALAALPDAAGVERVQGELERWARQLGLHPTAATILGPPQAPVEKVDARTLAQMWADETPEMLARIEDDTMHSLQLPEERRPILQRDLEATQRAHRDKAGEPYILHPLRVALRVHTERERLAAVLHDVVEDTGVTLDRSEWMGVARTPGWVRRGTVSRQRRTRRRGQTVHSRLLDADLSYCLLDRRHKWWCHAEGADTRRK